jgi:hypothetical protein
VLAEEERKRRDAATNPAKRRRLEVISAQEKLKQTEKNEIFCVNYEDTC